jgi:hypothetical protein
MSPKRCRLQIGYLRNDIEVCVAVDNTGSVADRDRGNETVVDATNCFAGAPGSTIDICRGSKVDRVVNGQRGQPFTSRSSAG